jgi:hypothetical protein
MPTKEEIVIAIGEHIWWKNEFEKAVSDGWHFFNPELAQRSNHSDLGMWLDDLSFTEQDSEHFRKIQSLHADFQEAVAEVVQMASSGQIELAEASIQTGLYSHTSTALTIALRSWMDSLKDEHVQGLQTMQIRPKPDQKRPEG